MKLLSAACSDRGIKKKINQDSLLVRSAMTKEGEILLAAVCDGMGGLEKGEVASGEVIRALARWFEETLPLLLSGGQEKKGVGERRKRAIAKSLESLIQEENQMSHFYSIGISEKLDVPQIRKLLTIGLLASLLHLAGDLILG